MIKPQQVETKEQVFYFAKRSLGNKSWDRRLRDSAERCKLPLNDYIARCVEENIEFEEEIFAKTLIKGAEKEYDIEKVLAELRSIDG